MKPTPTVALCAAFAVSACSAAQTNSSNPPAILTSNGSTQQTTQSFEAFFNDFKLALSLDKLDTLQSYIHFPLTVRGELDNSPTVNLTQENFAAFFTDLLSEPVYIEQNDELIAHALSELATQPKLEKPGQASWQGFIFEAPNGQWALSEIITYDHLIELHQ